MVFLRDLANLWKSFLASDISFFILIGVLLVLSLLYYVSAQRVRASATDGALSGWLRPAERRQIDNSDLELLILRPSGRHYFFYLVNAGLTLGLGIVVLQTLRGGNPSPVITLWFGLFCVFVGLWFLAQAVWLLRRIEVQGNSIVIQSPIWSARHYDLRDLTALVPSPRTFSEGARLRFGKKRHVDVPARFEGYKDLLIHLARLRPQIQGIVDAADPTHN